MLNWTNLTWMHLFILLLVLHLTPLWGFTYFPSQDGPSHIYNALMLKEYHQHQNYKIRDVWKLNITTSPTGCHILRWHCFSTFSRPSWRKKYFSLCWSGWSQFHSFTFCMLSINEDSCSVALPFSSPTNYLLFIGFYNFNS